MKIIVRNDELNQKIATSISLLCETVKLTLGPKGRNAIISSSDYQPFITNDGVTIAKNIASDDEIVNAILEIAKSSSIKTDELVGDGTTTTLVILESLIHNGLKSLKEINNPMILKEELDIALKKTLDYLKKWKKLPTDEMLKDIAIISSNDQEIGNIIADVFFKIQNKRGIKIIDTDKPYTTIKYYNGYIIDTNIASNYFFINQNSLNFNNVKLLLVDNYLNYLDCISNILNECIDRDLTLVIIAKDYSEDFINRVLSEFLDNNLKVILLKNPMYGEKELIMNQDLASISKAKIINNLESISYGELGSINSIEITKDKTIMSYEKNKSVEARIKGINEEIEKLEDEFIIEYYEERLSMLKNGLAIIYVGAPTRVECLEKKMRYDDALSSISSAKNGVLPGAGLSLYKVSSYLQIKNDGEKILKEALTRPIIQILLNAGVDEKNILAEIKKSNYEKLYNVVLDNFENVDNTKIIDSYMVLEKALTNACSIAKMLLTTSAIIINETKVKYETEYNNL